jgi:uncharacterized protein YxjI
MLNLSSFLVKEEVSFLKLTDRFNIFDPGTGAQVGFAKENISMLLKIMRLFVDKRFLPTTVEIVNNNNEILFSIKKAPMFIRAKVDILDSKKSTIGYFKSRFLSLGGRFDVFDTKDSKLAEVKGDWKGWNFRFIGVNEKELGSVTKKWAGIGKEFFTSADNYMININKDVSNPVSSLLLLAAGLAIDIVYKEKK